MTVWSTVSAFSTTMVPAVYQGATERPTVRSRKRPINSLVSRELISGNDGKREAEG